MSEGRHRQSGTQAGERSYRRESSCGFHNSHHLWGELASYWTLPNPIRINTLDLTTSEALLAVLMHPQRPDLQRKIAETPYPTLAKRIGESVAPSQTDWEHKRVQAMRLCLRLKAQTNHHAIAKVLEDTGTSDIVEISGYDTFWGTRPTRDGQLIGHNVHGRLWMELRQQLADNHPLANPEQHTEGFIVINEPIRLQQDPARDNMLDTQS